jgi:hypothetical protein
MSLKQSTYTAEFETTGPPLRVTEAKAPLLFPPNMLPAPMHVGAAKDPLVPLVPIVST